MLVRIVKMSFKQENVDDFTGHFEQFKNDIRNFKGCSFLELYRDLDQENVFFTYSYWEDEQDLEQYRNSELFKGVWQTTRAWFDKKPQAWSVEKLISLY